MLAARWIPIALLLGELALSGGHPGWAQPAKPESERRGPDGAGGSSPREAPSADAARERLRTMTDAERVTFLRQAIAENQRRLARLTAEREDPRGEYGRAEAEFREIERRLIASKEALERARAAGRAREVAQLREEVEGLGRRWNLAKERFDLAIERRRIIPEEIATLQQMIAGDQASLERISGGGPTPAPDATGPRAPSGAAPPVAPTPVPQDSPPAPSAPGGEHAPGLAAPGSAPPGPTAGGAPAPAVSPAPVPGSEPSRPRRFDRAGPRGDELVRAEAEVKRRQEQLREAERRAVSLRERLEALDKRVELEERRLETSRKQADNAAATGAELAAQLEARAPRPSGAQRAALRTRIDEVRRDHERAEAEVREHTALLERLRAERAFGREAEVLVGESVERARRDLERAEGELADITNPLSPRNLLAWAVDHGPRILAILALMLILRWLVRVLGRRVVRTVVQRGTASTGEEALSRANTLVGVFQHAAASAILVGGVLMILQESGVPVTPLLGGAAVLGLAVAFGAQNLLRDYFQGFMILLENQFQLRDVVKINNLSGQVEAITLRMTALRDLEGNVHFIPNGEIKAVTNMTHGWSRAVVDLPIPYQEDLDQVTEVIADVGRELRGDPHYAAAILDDPTILGVDALGEHGVVLKFYITTAPRQQWRVRRELLARIKRRFDELGIALPFAPPPAAQPPAGTAPQRASAADGPRPAPPS